MQAFVTAYSRKVQLRFPTGTRRSPTTPRSCSPTRSKRSAQIARKIRDYLANLSENIAFHGVTGAIRFGADGDPDRQGIVMTRVHDGALLVEANQ